MQEAADRAEISVRTLRLWARIGERLKSGPLHDIATAVSASKKKRGFGPRQIPVPASPRSERVLDEGPLQALRPSSFAEHSVAGSERTSGRNVAFTRVAWAETADPLRPEELYRPLGPPSIPDPEPAILNHPAAPSVLEAGAQIESAAATTNSSTFQILEAELRIDGCWKKFVDVTEADFEILRGSCDQHRFGDLYGSMVRRQRWRPREGNNLTPALRNLVEKGLRVLARDSSGFAQIDFGFSRP